MSYALAAAFARVLQREEFVERHVRALEYKRQGRKRAIEKVPEWEELRAKAARLKAQSIPKLDELVVRFQENAEKSSTKIHFADTAADANRQILDILREKQVKRVVKSKSMTTEECGLNPFLEKEGIEVVDTDLGEYIVQLLGEAPSHIVTPAIHKSRQEIGALFAEHGICEAGEEDPKRLTRAARVTLRKVFLAAEAGITGANFLVAENGSFVVVENEGNALLGTSLPRLHIVVAGIEKVVERTSDLAVFLALLARSATGQRVTTYTTSYMGPQPNTKSETKLGLEPRELHIVLLDNGRRKLIGTPAEEALGCIRCGACLTCCPVFRRIGGHAYSFVLPGPIGQVLGPQMGGSPELVTASPLCRLCNETCPVGIDLAGALHSWRGRLRQQDALPPSLPPGLSFLLRHPRLVEVSRRSLRGFGRVGLSLLARTKWLRAWQKGAARKLPELPKEGFRSWYRKRAKREAETGSLEYCQPSEGIAQDSLAPKREKKQPELAELEATFSEALAEAGGTCLGLDELPSPLVATKAARSILASLGHELPLAPFGQHELDALPWLVATASWRVARTGSLWVDMEEAECRAQYLLPEGLILIVRKSEILYDLPEHYARLSLLSSVGSLVTGPSKTADIELSLVHGAHGPKSLIVVCYHESDS